MSVRRASTTPTLSACRRPIHLLTSMRVSGTSARQMLASHCGPVSEVSHQPSLQLGAEDDNHDSGHQDAERLEDRRNKPLVGSRRVGEGVERGAETHHHERHGQRCARTVGARLVRARRARRSGKGQDATVEDQGRHREAVGDGQRQIACRKLHDIRVRMVHRDHHEADRRCEQQQLQDHARPQRHALVHVEDRCHQEPDHQPSSWVIWKRTWKTTLSLTGRRARLDGVQQAGASTPWSQVSTS